MNYNVTSGDLGYWWRVQGERSMKDLDTLIQYKLHFANKLTPEKVQEIEEDVNLFQDADQFRIFHAKGRWRGTISAFLVTAGFSQMMGGRRGGFNYMQRNPLIAGPIFVASWVTFYQFWTRYCGYTSAKYNEFQYARIHKMLRNAQVKQ